MYSNPVEVTLPDSFYAALDNVVDTVKEGFANKDREDSTAFYNKNLLNHEDITLIAPKFNETNATDYRLIGRSLMEGMADIFFSYWEKYNDSEDYYKTDNKEIVKTPIEQVAPIVKVTIPEKKEPENDSILDNLPLPLTALLLGIETGTTLWGQIIESIALLPKLLANSGQFAKIITGAFSQIPNILSKIKGLGITIVQSMANVTGAFSKLVSFANNFKFASTGINKVMGTIGNYASNITKVLSKSAANLGLKIASKLKFLPFIGTILGFYQSYLRFERGEYFLGTLELAAAIATMLPGPGTAIAIGINILQGILESGNTSIGGISTLLFKAVPSIGSKLIAKLTGTISSTILKPLSLVLKRIPLLGSLISFGMAVSDFSNGETLSGSLNILSGLGGLVDIVAPGVGTALAIAIDALNIFLNSTETGQQIITKAKDIGSSISSAVSNWYNQISLVADVIYNKILGAYNAVIDSWNAGINSLVQTLDNWGTNITEWFAETKQSIIDTFDEIFAGFSITNLINNLSDSAKQLVTNISNKITSFFSNLFESVNNYFTGKVTEIKQKFDSVTTYISDIFTFSTEGNLIDSCLDSIKNSFTKIWSDIKGAISDWWSSITNKITSLTDGYKSSIKNFIGNIGNFFGGSDKAPSINSNAQPEVRDVRTISTPKQSVKIDPRLVNNQLTNDKNIKSISENIIRNDSATSISVGKLCTIADAILSQMINNPGKGNIITTNNIIAGNGSSSRVSSSTISDPRLIYSN